MNDKPELRVNTPGHLRFGPGDVHFVGDDAEQLHAAIKAEVQRRQEAFRQEEDRIRAEHARRPDAVRLGKLRTLLGSLDERLAAQQSRINEAEQAFQAATSECDAALPALGEADRLRAEMDTLSRWRANVQRQVRQLAPLVEAELREALWQHALDAHARAVAGVDSFKSDLVAFVAERLPSVAAALAMLPHCLTAKRSLDFGGPVASAPAVDVPAEQMEEVAA